MDFIDRKNKETIGINITSMVDVLFILLIFVLVSTTFLEQPALNIELPKAKSAGLEKVEELIVSISKGGELYLNDQVVNREEMVQRIAGELARDKDLPVILKADKNVPYGLVIEVMDIMRNIGVKRLVALTSYPDK